jgi:hypothetical protein
MSIYITNDNGRLTMQSSTKVQMNSLITIAGSGTELPITIEGDFKDIPQNLHQLYMQSMLASYGSVNVYNNTEPEPKTIKEQKSEWRLNKIVNLIFNQLKNKFG